MPAQPDLPFHESAGVRAWLTAHVPTVRTLVHVPWIHDAFNAAVGLHIGVGLARWLEYASWLLEWPATVSQT